MEALKPETNADLLKGETVQLWPYVRGHYPRGVLAAMWQMIEDDGASGLLFSGPVVETGMVLQRGDLVQFVEAVTAPLTILFMVQDRASSDMVGCIWFDNVVQGHRAFASIFMRKACRGAMTQEASHLALRYMFDTCALDAIWCMSPWPVAVKLARTLGFQDIAVLPRFRQDHDGFRNVTMLCLMRESYHG